MWDADGKEYLDLLGGIAVNALGHAHPASSRRSPPSCARSGTSRTSSPPSRSSSWPSGCSASLGWSDDARRLLQQLRRRGQRGRVQAHPRAPAAPTLVAAEGAFHGRTMGALALTAKAAYREPFEPLPGRRHLRPVRRRRRARGRGRRRRSPRSSSSRSRARPASSCRPTGYLAAARASPHEHGALLWLDEIQTGVGRTGEWFAYQPPGIAPDVVTLAKGLGGGFPIGALHRPRRRGDAAPARATTAPRSAATRSHAPPRSPSSTRSRPTACSDAAVTPGRPAARRRSCARTRSSTEVTRRGAAARRSSSTAAYAAAGRRGRAARPASSSTRRRPTRLRLAPPLIITDGRRSTRFAAPPGRGILDAARAERRSHA